MDTQLERAKRKRHRRAQWALRRARRYMADPTAKLPRILAAHAELKARGMSNWEFPDV